MSSAELQPILAEIAELKKLVAEGINPSPVVDVAGACAVVGLGSPSALGRWCQTWRVKPCGKGRYARRALLAGLQREADSCIPKRRTPERQTEAAA